MNSNLKVRFNRPFWTEITMVWSDEFTKIQNKFFLILSFLQLKHKFNWQNTLIKLHYIILTNALNYLAGSFYEINKIVLFFIFHWIPQNVHRIILEWGLSSISPQKKKLVCIEINIYIYIFISMLVWFDKWFNKFVK